jgi:hypothetical protein
MPTQQLSVMVKNLRAEAGHSLSTAQGVNQLETLKYLLARTQEELWTAFQWPDLTIRYNKLMSANLYLYDFLPQMPFDAIRSAWVGSVSLGDWIPIDYGISEDMIHWDEGNSAKGDPVQVWDVEADATGVEGRPAKFRVWPTPTVNNTYAVRFKGNKSLDPFIADDDYCTLDATLIVLFAAAELLARAKAEDAPGKAQKAQRHLLKLLGNKISGKNKVSTIGSGSPDRRSLNNVIRVGAGG